MKVFLDKFADSIVFLLILIIVFASIFIPIAYQQSLAPPNTLFPFGGGFFPDFYQYLGWVNDGMLGNILLTTRYTETFYPRVLIHPLFPLIGYIGSLFRFPAYSSYLLARIASTGVFIFSYFLLVRASIKNISLRALSLILFLSFSGFWTIKTASQEFATQDFIPWSENFNVLNKFNLPPHHLLALSALLFILWIFQTKRLSLRTGILLTALVISLGFLNPSILSLALPLWLVVFCVSFTPIGSSLVFLKKPLIICLSIGIIVFFYHFLLFQYVIPWSILYEKMKQFDPPTSFTSYLFALGPLVYVALLSLKEINRNRTVLIFLFLWAYLPFVFFLLRGTFIPINGSRLFQSYQYIPLSILGAIGIDHLAGRIRSERSTMIYCIFGLASLMYGILPFVAKVRTNAKSLNPVWFNVYIPESLIDTFTYLSSSTPNESVVLASELTSQMIPAFSHNRTILARDGLVPDYTNKLNLSYAFFDGKLNKTEAERFVQTYHISYVIYGLDLPSFWETPQSYRDFMTPVYSNGSIVLVRVTGR